MVIIKGSPPPIVPEPSADKGPEGASVPKRGVIWDPSGREKIVIPNPRGVSYVFLLENASRSTAQDVNKLTDAELYKLIRFTPSKLDQVETYVRAVENDLKYLLSGVLVAEKEMSQLRKMTPSGKRKIETLEKQWKLLADQFKRVEASLAIIHKAKSGLLSKQELDKLRPPPPARPLQPPPAQAPIEKAPAAPTSVAKTAAKVTAAVQPLPQATPSKPTPKPAAAESVRSQTPAPKTPERNGQLIKKMQKKLQQANMPISPKPPKKKA